MIVWVLTAMAHYCDPSPNKRPDVLLSVVTWRGETKCMLFFTIEHCLFPPLSSLSIKDISVCFSIDPHPFQYVGFLLLLSCSTIFSNIIFFKSLHSIVCLPSIFSLPSLPTQYPISFPLPCHLCTTVIMAD